MLAVIAAVVIIVAGGAAVWSVAQDTDATSGAAAPGDGADSDGEPERAEDPDTGPRLVETCGTSDLLAIPGTEVTIEPLTLEQEIEIGEDTRELVFEVYKASDDVATEAALTGLLEELSPSTSSVPYSMTLLDSPEVNAFATPGGAIYFTSEIVELMTEDELAFVVAHEIAHVECRHLPRQFEREALVAAGLSVVLGQEVDVEDLYANAAASVLTGLASMSFSRDDEAEADLAALDLMETAGRPLAASVEVMQVLLDLEDEVELTQIDVFFSTHPPTSDRIDALRTAIENRR